MVFTMDGWTVCHVYCPDERSNHSVPQSITQGRTISIGEDVRMLRNVDTHRMFTIRQSVGFTVEFEEDILSGGSWILDTLQTGGRHALWHDSPCPRPAFLFSNACL